MKPLSKLLTLILFCFVINICFSQNTQQEKLSEKDSITYSKLKLKFTQAINLNPDSALYFVKKLKEFSAQKNYSLGSADAQYFRATYFRRVQKPDSAIIYFKKYITAATKINHLHGIATGYNGLCRVYYLTGDIEKSIEAGNTALRFTKKYDEGSNTVFADTQNAIAIAYTRQNKMEEAIKRLLVVDSLQTKNPLRADIIAAAYQSLGNIYLELKDYDYAESYYLKANKEFETIPGAGTFYFNTTNVYLGQVYYHKGDFAEANKLLTKTHQFFSEINDERTLSEINNYLGLINLGQNNLTDAETYFQNAYVFQKKNEYFLEAAQSAIQLGQLNIAKKDLSEAINFFEEALQLNKTTRNGNINQEAHKLLSEAYAQTGNYNAAYTHSQIASQIRDSIAAVQTAEKIKEIEGIYQTESRDKEISLLTIENNLASEQKANQRNVFIAILSIVTLAGLFFFFQLRNRQKTNKKLQELDTAKSTFFTNISHDFRTPLTLIKGPIEDQLANPDITQINRKNLNAAYRNAERLENLVGQLLSLSKLKSSAMQLNVQPGSLETFLQIYTEAFRYQADEQELAFKLTTKIDQTQTWFDQDILEKILYNILGNALKFTTENGSIKINGTLKDGNFILDVYNSYPKLSKDEKERLFTRFYQTSATNEGSGIGLSLVKQLVSLHKGNISVQDAKDGISFNVEIPINKSAYKESEILNEALRTTISVTQINVDEDSQPIINLNNDAPLLLVVDDAEDIRNYVESIFQENYKVLKAKDGEEAYALAIEHIPDIIVSDVLMPKIDGYSLTRDVKKNPLTSHIPILLLTAKNRVVDQLEGMGIGADAYTTKPFSSKLLRATVDNLIENRRKLQKRFAQEIMLTPKELAITSAEENFLNDLQKTLDENLTDPEFNSTRFSEVMFMNRMQLHRKLKALTGLSTSEFIKLQRLKIAAKLIKEKELTVSEVGYTIGFNDPSYFTKCFKQEFGVTPKDFV